MPLRLINLGIAWRLNTLAIESRKAPIATANKPVLLSDKANLNYGLRLPDAIIEPNSGKQHFDSCLKFLALYGLNDATE